jgi:hypothetical protein
MITVRGTYSTTLTTVNLKSGLIPFPRTFTPKTTEKGGLTRTGCHLWGFLSSVLFSFFVSLFWGVKPI